MANRKVGIIEKLKREDGTWTNVPVHFSRSRTSGKGRRGKFLLVWREGGQRIYHPLPNYKDGNLPLLGEPPQPGTSPCSPHIPRPATEGCAPAPSEPVTGCERPTPHFTYS